MSWKERFDELLPCINIDCDNNGIIAVQDIDHDGETTWYPEQCEYCYKVRLPIKDFIEALLKETEQRVAKEIFKDISKCATFNDMVSEYNSGRSDAFKQLEQLREKYIKGVE